MVDGVNETETPVQMFVCHICCDFLPLFHVWWLGWLCRNADRITAAGEAIDGLDSDDRAEAGDPDDDTNNNHEDEDGKAVTDIDDRGPDTNNSKMNSPVSLHRTLLGTTKRCLKNLVVWYFYGLATNHLEFGIWVGWSVCLNTFSKQANSRLLGPLLITGNCTVTNTVRNWAGKLAWAYQGVATQILTQAKCCGGHY